VCRGIHPGRARAAARNPLTIQRPRVLGIAVPPSLLFRANEVIEWARTLSDLVARAEQFEPVLSRRSFPLLLSELIERLEVFRRRGESGGGEGRRARRGFSLLQEILCEKMLSNGVIHTLWICE
jgi:hypothetical protein